MAELARTFTVPALNKLAHLMYHAKSEAIQMHAANTSVNAHFAIS